MSSSTLLAFLSVGLVSLVSLVGLLTLSMNEVRLRRIATVFVGFAAGALLGDAFIHLIPEIFASSESSQSPLGRSLLILVGVVVFFVVEKLLRHQHMLDEHPHTVSRPALAAVNVLGDAIHNYIDGLLIGASYLVGPELGITTTIAVLLHEIPQEIGDFGILIHSGLSVRKATMMNLASAGVAVFGTLTAVAAGGLAQQRVSDLLVPIAAGGFVYIAAADLMPELQHDRSIRSLVLQTTLIVLGIAIMALLTLID